MENLGKQCLLRMTAPLACCHQRKQNLGPLSTLYISQAPGQVKHYIGKVDFDQIFF